MPSGLYLQREDAVKRLLLFLVLIGVAITAAAYWYNPTSRSTGEEGYTLMPVEYGTLKESISATGQLQPERGDCGRVSVARRSYAKIHAEADVNQVVKKGQPLLQLDDRLAKQKLQAAKDAVQVAQTGVAQAESALKAAQAAYDHARDLWKKNVLPNEKRVQVKYQLDAAKDTVAAAKLKVDTVQNEQRGAQLGLDLLTIRAPVAGRIIQRNVLLGQMAGPTSPTPLFLIASDMSRMQVNALVAEGDIGKMRVGLTATFTVYAYSENNEEFSGQG